MAPTGLIFSKALVEMSKTGKRNIYNFILLVKRLINQSILLTYTIYHISLWKET